MDMLLALGLALVVRKHLRHDHSRRPSQAHFAATETLVAARTHGDAGIWVLPRACKNPIEPLHPSDGNSSGAAENAFGSARKMVGCESTAQTDSLLHHGEYVERVSPVFIARIGLDEMVPEYWDIDGIFCLGCAVSPDDGAF